MLVRVSRITFKGEVAELATTPGKNPHVPLVRRVFTYRRVMKASSIKAFLKSPRYKYRKMPNNSHIPARKMGWPKARKLFCIDLERIINGQPTRNRRGRASTCAHPESFCRSPSDSTGYLHRARRSFPPHAGWPRSQPQ